MQNILLNNYTKYCNDRLDKEENYKRKRSTLKTFYTEKCFLC